MHLLKHLPVGISTLALAVSACSLFLNYKTSRVRTLPPEIFTRVDEFHIDNDPITVGATLQFSVSNRSSEPVSIVDCNVTTNGLNTGGGGVGERFEPCHFASRSNEIGLPLKIEPGQTQFYSVTHKQDITSYDPSFALQLMGIELKEISKQLKATQCKVSFGVSYDGSSLSQNCAIVSAKRDVKAFELVLQTGAGQTIRKPINLCLKQDWPWQRY